MSNEAYARVIDLIADGGIDFRALGIELAKSAPEAFLMLHDKVSGAPKSRDDALDQQIIQQCAAGLKIDAIKLYRAETGAGLKEAKDYVDALYDRYQHGELAKRPITINADGIKIDALRAALQKSLAREAPASRHDYKDGGSF